MQKSQFKIQIVLAVMGCAIGCTLLVFAITRFSAPGFYSRWSSLKDGMTEAEVRQVLGTPTQILTGPCIGAGGKPVTRWEYHRAVVGRFVDYYVDYDYIGPGGAPAVFRTERCCQDWDCPSWGPGRAKCR